MNFAEYAPLALRTCKPLPHAQAVEHALLGCITEMGELADMVKRHVIYDKPLDKTNGMEEIGDLFWYINLFCDEQRIHPLLISDSLAAINFKSADTGTPLMTFTILLGSMVGALLVPLDVRGVPHIEVVKSIVQLLAVFCHRMGYTVEQTLDLNIRKLVARFGDKYTDFSALNRDVGAERIILEGTGGGAA